MPATEITFEELHRSVCQLLQDFNVIRTATLSSTTLVYQTMIELIEQLVRLIFLYFEHLKSNFILISIQVALEGHFEFDPQGLSLFDLAYNTIVDYGRENPDTIFPRIWNRLSKLRQYYEVCFPFCSIFQP